VLTCSPGDGSKLRDTVDTVPNFPYKELIILTNRGERETGRLIQDVILHKEVADKSTQAQFWMPRV